MEAIAESCFLYRMYQSSPWVSDCLSVVPPGSGGHAVPIEVPGPTAAGTTADGALC